jgi:glutamate-1-semialdehyde 2,1-aminomutase
MPVGAYASSAEIMKHVSPDGPVYQAGTLSGNPVAMAAGLATLEKIGRAGFYEELEARTARLADGLREAAAAAGTIASVVQLDSLFWTVFQDPAPNRFDQIDGDMSSYGTLHRALLERGVYLAPSGWEVGFVSAAHTDEDVDRTAAAVAEVLSDL